MKIPLMAAAAALAVWGCSSNSARTRADDSAIGGSGPETAAPESAQDGEATGGSGLDADAGTPATTPEGERYDVQEGPLLDGQRSEDVRDDGLGGSGNLQDGDSQVEERDASGVRTREVRSDEVEVDSDR